MKKRLLEQIVEGGPLPFDEYMAACLYDPDEGFFSAGPLRSGENGDFVTSPEISAWFGVLIGRWAKQSSLGREVGVEVPPEGGALPILIEVGAGSGSLLGPLIAETGTAFGDVYAVESSRAARSRIAKEHPTVTVAATLDEIPAGVDAVIVANEVLDNMPVALARSTTTGWREIGVGTDAGELTLVELPARREVSEWCDEVFGSLPVGTAVTVQLIVDEWISALFKRFGRVLLCLIDYAAPSEELAVRSMESLIRSYRRQRTGHDWLQYPGEVDITVDVNVDGVTRAIGRAGSEVHVMSQRDFLMMQGVSGLIEDARGNEAVSAREGEIMAQLAARSERIAIEALLDPAGLGGFTVVLVE